MERESTVRDKNIRMVLVRNKTKLKLFSYFAHSEQLYLITNWTIHTFISYRII